jgi:hypothetical protein
VTDDGVPPLSATNTYVVFVNPAPIIPAPVILSISLADGIATVTWTSVTNGTYRLQCAEALGQTNWVDLLPDVRAAGSTATATNAIDISTQRFYRVWVVPLP